MYILGVDSAGITILMPEYSYTEIANMMCGFLTLNAIKPGPDDIDGQPPDVPALSSDFTNVAETTENKTRLISSKCCDFCGKVLPTELKSHTHIYLSHPSNKKMYQCEICLKQFFHLNLMRKHVSRVHVPEENYVTCSICFKKFKNKYLCKAHIDKKHFGTMS